MFKLTAILINTIFLNRATHMTAMIFVCAALEVNCFLLYSVRGYREDTFSWTTPPPPNQVMGAIMTNTSRGNSRCSNFRRKVKWDAVLLTDNINVRVLSNLRCNIVFQHIFGHAAIVLSTVEMFDLARWPRMVKVLSMVLIYLEPVSSDQYLPSLTGDASLSHLSSTEVSLGFPWKLRLTTLRCYPQSLQ